MLLVINHPRRLRGGQSGRDKRRRKFTRTGERTHGMLLLKNQFHYSLECLSLIVFLCPIGSQKKYEIVACLVNVWGSDCGLIEGKFINTKVLLALFMQLCKFTLPASFDPLV